MPIYEYICDGCGHEFEALVRGDEKPECPTCGRAKLSKQFSAPAAHTGASPPPCPARNTCPAPHCCGQNCGLGDMM